MVRGDRGIDTEIFPTKKETKVARGNKGSGSGGWVGFVFFICCFLVANTLVELCRIRHF